MVGIKLACEESQGLSIIGALGIIFFLEWVIHKWRLRLIQPSEFHMNDELPSRLPEAIPRPSMKELEEMRYE